MSSPSVGQSLIPQAITQFRASHGDVHVTFSSQNYVQMKERLLNQQADLGIVILPMDHPNLRVEPIGQARMVCICPPDHPLARRGLLTLRDLKPFPMIGYDPHTPFGGIVEQMYERADEPLAMTMEVGSPQNACALVEMGAGIALVDEFSVRSRPGDQCLALPVLDAPALVANLVHPRFEPLSQLAQAFADTVRALMVRNGFGIGDAMHESQAA